MNLTDVLIILVTGVIAGFLNTVAGGGSLISLPVLIFLGMPSQMANGTNRVSIFIQSVFAIKGFDSKGISAWPYSGWLGLSALVGALIGAKFAVDIQGELFNRILAVVMIAVILFTVFNPVKKADNQAEKLDRKHRIIGIISFFFVGIYGGFIQAGVGFIIIAVLTQVNGFSLVKTNSAKAMIVLIYTLAALVVFIYEGQVNWAYGFVLSVGNAVGAWFSSRWSANVDEKLLKWIVLVCVILMAIKLMFFSH